jgi:uncharacterized pyridoxal phosphate-containing UPF0001 family protein
MSVYENTKLILENIGSTTLVCITKTIEPERINEAIRAGATIIGENRFRSTRINVMNILPCETHLTGLCRRIKSKKPYVYLMLFSQLTP